MRASQIILSISQPESEDVRNRVLFELILLQSDRIGLNIERITSCRPKLSIRLLSDLYLSGHPDSIAHGGIFSPFDSEKGLSFFGVR